MNSRVSPFARLTGDEKQIKWLEYQSVALPYVQGSVEPPMEREAVHEPRSRDRTPLGALEQPSAPVKPQGREQTKKPASPTAADLRQARHSQYDAVIARMKQAEKSARTYQTLS